MIHRHLIGDLVENAVMQLGDLPDIYIITPFTSVKASLNDKLRPLLNRIFTKSNHPGENLEKIDAWLKDHCGTIHTFQGKEANEVLLLLGCDGSAGLSAAKLVGQKPNIINVALSRAKYRVGIIGCFNLWSQISYVSEVCELLKDNRVKLDG